MRGRTKARRAMRYLTSLVVAALLMAACTAAPPTQSPTPEAAPETTVYGQLFDRVGDDGSVDLQLALDAFATVIAPLPGVQPPTGPAPHPWERAHGTFATRWIMRHYDALTPEQRAAVDAAFEPDADAITVMPEEGEAGGVSLAVAQGGVRAPSAAKALEATGALTAATQREEYVAILKQSEGLIAQKLGRTLRVPWRVSFNDEDEGESALAYTRPFRFRGSGLLGCEFQINPRLRSSGTPEIRATLAHEMFHCFQLALVRHTVYDRVPGWILEGQAEWVGEALMGPSSVGVGYWRSYLTTPQVALFAREYSATGYYWHMVEAGIDPWSHLDAMLLAHANNVEAFKAAGTVDDGFLDTWASGLAREAPIGAAWDTKSIWAVPEKAPPQAITITSAAALEVSAPIVTNAVYRATSTADVVEVRVEGHARLGAPGGTDVVGLQQLWLCTKPGGCRCPQGTDYDGPPLRDAPQTFHVALTGSLTGSSGRLLGHELREFCRSRPAPTRRPGRTPRPPKCLPSCANSNGDPHLFTVDGVGYDFMTAGEFVALQSADGSVEVQVRQQPYQDFDNVTINTAVAVRDGEDVVGLYLDVESGGLSARVDGAEWDGTDSTELPGGGLITPLDGGWQLDLEEGSTVWALAERQYGINLVVSPSDDVRARGTGILGVVPADSMGIPALPDGMVLPPTADGREAYRALYVTFADAWRVTDASSLFEYEPGTSTAAFTIPGFPAEEDLIGLDDLTDTQIAAGEAACAGVKETVLHAQCVYDVGVTSDPGFAEGYRLVEAETLPDSGLLVRLVNVYDDGDADRESMDVYGRSNEGEALLATVPWGEVSDWIEPGYTEFAGERSSSIILRREGEGGVLFETTETLSAGDRVTFIVATGPEDSVAPGGGRSVWFGSIFEEHAEFPLRDAPPGQALLVVDTLGLQETQASDAFLYAGVGDGCLVSPEADRAFPAPQPFGSGSRAELVVEPGEHALTIHGDPGLGAFPECVDAPILPPIPLTLAAGDRHLIVLYGPPDSAEVRAVSVPLSRSSGRGEPAPTPAPGSTSEVSERSPTP